ncbi:MAG: MlaA family lipoprotein [Rubrivivax sp.]|jgi:phospholipid-binding lipoprotein MlaA
MRRSPAVAHALAAAAVCLVATPVLAADDIDPWEPFNRKVHAFNESLDDAVLRPVATVWRDVVPDPLRTVVGNVFGNVEDAWSALNQLLQAKPGPAVTMTVRFAVNTVVGLGGVLDVASEMGLERQSEDLGQTLGRWGVGAGPYLVLPLIGPKSLRDAAAWPIDRAVSLPGVVDDTAWRWSLTGVEVVHNRANLLGASALMEQIALDRYTFTRDGYLARRRNLVYDGEPPEEDDNPKAREPLEDTDD